VLSNNNKEKNKKRARACIALAQNKYDRLQIIYTNTKKINTMQNKIEILAAIDELNQYLNGNVTKSSLQITLDELINNL
jgi:hypothetical protein